MRHLITGGAGFLGYHVAKALAERGAEVDLADDLSRGVVDADLERLLARDGIRLLRGDLTDAATTGGWDDGYDTVCHFAGVVGVDRVDRDPHRVLSVNGRSVLNVVEWFTRSGSGRLLLASTSEVYAWTMRFHALPIPTPEDVPLAIDALSNRRATYAASKQFAEMVVVHSCTQAGRPYSIARFHNVYGPRMGFEHVIPELIGRIAAGGPALRVFSPDERRAFCYVSDAVDATLRLLQPDVPSGVYNVGDDREETTIRELAATLLELSGQGDMAIVAADRAATGIPRRCPDISRLRAATGYRPQVTLRDGLRRTIDWYREVLARR
jgi:nucleoside-diphosphate-sugar epimerase